MFHFTRNPSSPSFAYIWPPNLVITAPADHLAPNGARSSAGTVLTAKLHIISKFLQVSVIWNYFCWLDDDIKMSNDISWNIYAHWVLYQNHFCQLIIETRTFQSHLQWQIHIKLHIGKRTNTVFHVQTVELHILSCEFWQIYNIFCSTSSPMCSRELDNASLTMGGY